MSLSSFVDGDFRRDGVKVGDDGVVRVEGQRGPKRRSFLNSLAFASSWAGEEERFSDS